MSTTSCGFAVAFLASSVLMQMLGHQRANGRMRLLLPPPATETGNTRASINMDATAFSIWLTGQWTAMARAPIWMALIPAEAI